MRYLDTHVDTITVLMNNGDELYGNNRHLDIRRLEAFEKSIVFFAVFFDGSKPEKRYNGLFAEFLGIMDFLESEIAKNNRIAGIARTKAELLTSKHKIIAVPAIEDGGILEGNLNNLHTAAKLGVRYITLTWNHINDIGEPSIINGKGLTGFGHEMLVEMDKLSVLADVSHLSEAGFWDVVKFGKPFIASHSNCKSICNHHRNLNDEQIRAIRDIRGFIGLNFAAYFLGDTSDESRSVGIDDFCRHLEHAAHIAGEDSIGIGSDFDGARMAAGLETVADMPKFYDTLTTRYGKTFADNVFYDNFIKRFQ
ncbi:MAG: membrane dipeptidase [Defluviitaleaceae bacterium]|nr:membrane dipeptidase [Defluviitaleaceae bacterium]